MAWDAQDLAKSIDYSKSWFPALVLIVGDDAPHVAADAVRAIRARPDPVAHAPILVMGALDDSSNLAPATAPDGHLDPAGSLTILDSWAPTPNPSTDRLIAMFGRDEIARLSLSFRAFLFDALAEIARPQGSNIAHRVAGLAGTLGHQALGAAWSEISQSAGDRVAARQLTRMTIYEISRTFD